MFLGKDNFVRKHQGKEGFRRSKRGGPTCRSLLFVFVVAVVLSCLFVCLFACFMLFTTFAMPITYIVCPSHPSSKQMHNHCFQFVLGIDLVHNRRHLSTGLWTDGMKAV